MKYLVVFLSMGFTALGQDLSKLNKKELKISGGLSAVSTVYQANGIANRRDPFFWMLSGNLNFQIGSFSMPFSAAYTEQQRSYTQPFNQIGLSPTYKAFTFHAGYRNLAFSEFTLGGSLFLGGAIELAPKNRNYKFSLMYGRLAKAVNTLNGEDYLNGGPSYERWGYGANIALGSEKNPVSLILFSAADKPGSLSAAFADSAAIKPKNNLVLGLKTKQSIGPRMAVEADYAFSAYNRDLLSGSGSEAPGIFKAVPFLFDPTLSAQYNQAIQAALYYTAASIQVKIAYRRIDPEYKSLGATFLNNDLEDFSTTLTWRMWKQKLNISTGAGVQRNDLDHTLQSSMDRLLLNSTIQCAFSRKFSIQLHYSNAVANTRFNTRIRPVDALPVTANPDSLNFNQVTASAGGSVQYNTGNEQLRHILILSASFQQAQDSRAAQSIFQNQSLAYTFNLLKAAFTCTPSVFYNSTIVYTLGTHSYGPSLGLSKQLFKKMLRTNLSSSWLTTAGSGSVLNVRSGASVKKGKCHTFSVDIAYTDRQAAEDKGISFNEWRGSIAYGYAF